MIDMFLGKAYLAPKQEVLVDYLNEVIAKEGFEKVFNDLIGEYPKVFGDLPLKDQRRCRALELLLGTEGFNDFLRRSLIILASQRSSINRSDGIKEPLAFEGSFWAQAAVVIALIGLLIVVYVEFVKDVEECKEVPDIYTERVEIYCRQGVARWEGQVEVEVDVEVETEIECWYDDETGEEVFCIDWDEAAADAAVWEADQEQVEEAIDFGEIEIPEEESEIEWGDWEIQ